MDRVMCQELPNGAEVTVSLYSTIKAEAGKKAESLEEQLAAVEAQLRVRAKRTTWALQRKIPQLAVALRETICARFRFLGDRPLSLMSDISILLDLYSV